MGVRVTTIGLAAGLAVIGLVAMPLTASAAPKIKAIGAHTIPGKTYAYAVACPPGKTVPKETCMVVGQDTAGGNAISLVRRGKPGAPKSTTGGLSATCPSATICVTGGAEDSSTAPGGVVGTVSWFTSGTLTKTTVVDGTSDITGVGCETPALCVASGYINGKSTSSGTVQHGEVAIVKNTSSTVHAHRVAKTDQLSGVGCDANDSCVVVGFGGPTSSTHGLIIVVKHSKVGAARTAPGAGQLNDVSCGSSTTCWATGEHLSAKKGVLEVVTEVHNGKPLHARDIPEGTAAISCVSTTTCYLAGGKARGKSGQSSTGEVLRLVKGHVKAITLVPHTMGYSGISCPVSSSCLVTGPQSFHNPGPSSYWRSDVVVLKV